MNEDTFAAPASWRHSIHPRRGGTPVPYEPAPDPLPPNDSDVTVWWSAVLDGADERSVAEHWIAWHGTSFAARAGAELAALSVGRKAPVVRRLLGRVRAALADAPQQAYDEAVTELRQAREASLDHRLAASFLVPTEAGWVAQDLEDVPAKHALAPLLMASVSTVDHALEVLCRLAPTQAQELLAEPEMLHTLAEGIGDGILDLYAQHWTGRSIAYTMSGVPEYVRDMAAALPAVPTDRAFQALVDEAGRPGVQAAILAAGDRFPARAMRLLRSSAARPGIAGLLRRHAAKHPDLAPPGLRPTQVSRLREAPGALPELRPADDPRPGGEPVSMPSGPRTAKGSRTGEMPADVVAAMSTARPADEPRPGGTRDDALPTVAAARPGTRSADEPRPGGTRDDALPMVAATQPGTRSADEPRPGEVPGGALPAVLAAPPWAARRKAAKPVVLDLRCPDGPAVAWPPGVRERIVARLPGPNRHRDDEETARQIRAGIARDWEAEWFFLSADEELARPLLAVYRPVGARYGPPWLGGPRRASASTRIRSW